MSLLETIIKELDAGLRTLCPPSPRPYGKSSPATTVETNSTLTESEAQNVIGLMRVNHAGEVCAQALYRGQALTATLENVREQMETAALEEIDHLAWCEDRLAQLHGHTSVLNPIWYLGSLLIGAAAGLAGDKWSLGFVAETEKQVSKHLASHLQRIPEHDLKTRTILTVMQQDESLHAELAYHAGAAELPAFIKTAMTYSAKIMTRLSYYL